MKTNFKAPHKSVSNPLGFAVPIKPVAGHWSYKGTKGRKKRGSVQPSSVTITPGMGGFVVRRSSADKTVMAKGDTYEQARIAAYNLGYRFQKIGLSIKEISLGAVA
jgi:hypothetical protein